MRITDRRISRGARHQIIRTIIKEEVLPLVDDIKVKQYAESNLRELTDRAMRRAEFCGEEVTIDWLYDAIYDFVAYKRPDIIKDTHVDPNYEQDLDDGNMGAYEEPQMGHKKDVIPRVTPIKQQPKTIETIEYTVHQVTVNPKVKEIIEIQIATFIALQDAKDFVARKEEEIANTILLNKNRFYKIDTKIVKKISN